MGEQGLQGLRGPRLALTLRRFHHVPLSKRVTSPACLEEVGSETPPLMGRVAEQHVRGVCKQPKQGRRVATWGNLPPDFNGNA